jgi:predicted amidohydrolase YtcJ
MTQVEQVGHKAKEVLNFRAGGGATAPSTDTLARLLNLWFVVSGKTTVPGVAGVMPEQRLTRAEALNSQQKNCAWFTSLDGKVGTLETGNYTDLIVLHYLVNAQGFQFSVRCAPINLRQSSWLRAAGDCPSSGR